MDRKNTDIPSINRTVDVFDENVHEQVYFFRVTILNIFHNYIPNKNIICIDKDPPQFNNEIRETLTKKNEIFE